MICYNSENVFCADSRFLKILQKSIYFFLKNCYDEIKHEKYAEFKGVIL